MVEPCGYCRYCEWCRSEKEGLIIYHVTEGVLVGAYEVHKEEVCADCLRRAGILW